MTDTLTDALGALQSLRARRGTLTPPKEIRALDHFKGRATEFRNAGRRLRAAGAVISTGIKSNGLWSLPPAPDVEEGDHAER